MNEPVYDWDEHPALPRDKVQRVEDLMAERHGFEPLGDDMIAEVAYFVFVAEMSYDRLTVYNSRNAKRILSNIDRVRKQLRSIQRTLFKEAEGREILFRIWKQAYAKSGVHEDYFDMGARVNSSLAEILSRIPPKPKEDESGKVTFDDPTSPFSDYIEDIRGDIDCAIDGIPFNGSESYPSPKSWLSGYALPIIYFTTYHEETTGGAASDGHDTVGPLYTFVKELYHAITGEDVWGDTVRKNMRLLLKPRLRWIGPHDREPRGRVLRTITN